MTPSPTSGRVLENKTQRQQHGEDEVLPPGRHPDAEARLGQEAALHLDPGRHRHPLGPVPDPGHGQGTGRLPADGAPGTGRNLPIGTNKNIRNKTQSY